jgi:DNA-directed RNA polymerase specialized sigma24 family protein
VSESIDPDGAGGRPSVGGGGDVTTRTEEFEELRPLLFAIAYRILGSVSEAEDAVQEVWVRYSTVSTEPTSPRAYLSAVITRISINVLRDVFGFGFAEIASIIERSEQASRQLAVRARRHMEEGRPRFEATGASVRSSPPRSSRLSRRGMWTGCSSCSRLT